MKDEVQDGQGVPSNDLLALLRKVRDEIDALGEGIPMSAETWGELEDVLEANEQAHPRCAN